MTNAGTDIDPEPGRADGAAAGDTMTVAGWTMISRVTGFVKIATIGAVLGPTFFGNAYQFVNALPNFIYFGFLAGSLFSSLLVPALVAHIDAGDRDAAERVAGGFLGVTLLVMVPVVPVAIAVGPLVLQVSAGSGADQQKVAALLIVLVLPQLFLYGVVGTASAAMNARRRFALAAAAPAVENMGTVVVLVICAALYGVHASAADVSRGEILLLGLGSTAAVALHASVQWWGSRRSGTTLRPARGWQDTEVRTVMRRAVPSVAQAGLMALQMMTMLVLANRVAGGVVGFQIAVNFYFLAVALGATPVALSVLPRLARLHRDGDGPAFGTTLRQGYALGLFLAVPTAAAYLVLSVPIARAVAFGRLASDDGVALIASALAGLALAVVGQTIFMISSYASYALKDTRTPLAAMAVQAVVCLSLAATSLAVDGTAATAVVGAAFSASVLLSGWWLLVKVRRRFGGLDVHIAPTLLKSAVGAAVMIVPAWVITDRASDWLGERAALVVASAVGALIFIAVQVLLRADGVLLFAAGIRQWRSGAVTPVADHG
jgi:putative peptidoglycan lipid II flippase